MTNHGPETARPEPHQQKTSVSGQVTASLLPATESVSSLDASLPERHRPLLNLSAIRDLNSWDQVKQAYSERGVSFAHDAALLGLIKSDWARLRSILADEALVAPLPDVFPRTTVMCGDKPLDIYGMWHSIAAHPDVTLLLRRTTSQIPFLLTEENLGLLHYGIHSSGIDLPDHYARGVLSAVAQFEVRQLTNLFKWAQNSISQLFKRNSMAEAVGENFLQAQSPAARELQDLQRKLGLTNPAIAAFSRMSMIIPGDWGAELPANIELSYKHETGQRYTSSQARSAYMAEFLRHWDMESSLRNSAHKIPEEHIAEVIARKSILCGQSHEPEIAFFIKHGSQEAGVIERAKRDADAFNSGGVEALLGLHRQNLIKFWACETILSLVKGGSIGWGLTSLL